MKSLTHKGFSLLLPLLFTFPMWRENLVTLFFILLTANTLLHAGCNRPLRWPARMAFVYGLPFWIVLLFSLFHYSGPQTFAPVGNAVLFLLFPIVFALIPAQYFAEERLRFYFNILKNACLVMAIGYITAFLCIYSFDDFFVFRYDIPRFRDFVYKEIPFFRIHPTYFTCVVLFCTAFSMDNLLKRRRYSELIYVFVFLLITFLLLVKLNITLMIALLSFMLLFRSGLGLKARVMAFAGLAVLTAVLLATVPGISKRFSEMLKSYDSPPKGLAYDSTNIRVAIYSCDAEIAGDNLLTGVGFHRLADAMRDCFSSHYGSDFYKNDAYLTHNYFLYMLLSGGIGALVLFLLFTALVARQAVRLRRFLLSVGLLNLLLVSFTEDYFYRQYGLFFFCLIFYSYCAQGGVFNRRPMASC